MGRFFADEDFDTEIGQTLAQLGHDLDGVVNRGLGNKGTTDDEVLTLAAGEGRILLTHNRRHFVRLHRIAPSHAGIVVCSQRGPPEEMAGTIDRLLRELGSFAGRLVRVNLGVQTVA